MHIKGILTSLCLGISMVVFANDQLSQTPSELDSETALFLDGFSKTFASIDKLPIQEQRTTIKKMFSVPTNQLEPVAKVENKVAYGRHGKINVRLFTPKLEESLPVIIYFHRGGWVYGSLDESEVICRRLSNETGSIVVAVDYRLSPEHKFPIPLEDCYDATRWIIKHIPKFLGNPKKVILAGESAGGNLAAAVALMARMTTQYEVAGQLLIYPVLTSDLEKSYYDNSPDKYLLSYENMQFFWSMYLSSNEDEQNPLASPLKSENFANLPQAFILTADYDALKHEGAKYAEALERAKVPVQFKNYPGVIHGFLDLPLADPVKITAMKDIAAWINTL